MTIKMLARFSSGRNGSVLAKIDGKVSFVNRGIATQPRVDEVWEVRITSQNKSGTVNFLELVDGPFFHQLGGVHPPVDTVKALGEPDGHIRLHWNKGQGGFWTHAYVWRVNPESVSLRIADVAYRLRAEMVVTDHWMNGRYGSNQFAHARHIHAHNYDDGIIAAAVNKLVEIEPFLPDTNSAWQERGESADVLTEIFKDVCPVCKGE